MEGYAAVQSRDRRRPRHTLAAIGEKGNLLEIIAATHSGMTVEDFHKTVAEWIATARHPRFDRPYVTIWSTSRCWS